ncbi:hypothetical protein ACA910_017713 [Epithemia clementina (nom. ined.)]
MTGFTATIIKFITVLLITESFFLGSFYNVQACDVVTAVSKEISLLCPAGLESKIVKGLGLINECAKSKLVRTRHLKSSDQQRRLACPNCCNPNGGTCPYWWCKSQPGCRRRDLLNEGEEEGVFSETEDINDHDGRELTAALPWEGTDFHTIDNSQCLPAGNSALAICLQNAITAVSGC